MKLSTFSLEILVDHLGNVFDCLFDYCETEQFFEHKPGELNLNHTYQITGADEESVFLDKITSAPPQTTLRQPSSTSKPTSIVQSMRPSAPPQTTLRPPSSTSKPSTSIVPSMRPSESQDKTTCSNSPGLCAQFGILDFQVTCIDKSFDGQQQVIIDEYLIKKWSGFMNFDKDFIIKFNKCSLHCVGEQRGKSRDDHKSEDQRRQCLTAGSKWIFHHVPGHPSQNLLDQKSLTSESEI